MTLRMIDVSEDPTQHDKYGNLRRRLIDISVNKGECSLHNNDNVLSCDVFLVRPYSVVIACSSVSHTVQQLVSSVRTHGLSPVPWPIPC